MPLKLPPTPVAKAMGVYRIMLLGGRKPVVYIGSTNNLRRRWKRHVYDLETGEHKNAYLQRAWEKHGEMRFDFGILELIETECLLHRQEQKWLDVFRSLGPVFNFGHDVQPANRGLPMALETRKKISRALKGRKKPPQQIAKWLESRKGFKHTEATKERIRQTKLGQPTQSADARRQTGEASRARNSIALAVAAKVKPYPAFHNQITGERIAAGRNLFRLCKARELSTSGMYGVASGKLPHHKGWVIEGRELPVVPRMGVSDYPAFIHNTTDEIIPAGKNLAALCRRYGLRDSAMHHVKTGKHRQHKGWTLWKS